MTAAVVVTGVGLATPLGLAREVSWERLCAGESGIRPLPAGLAPGLGCSVAGHLDLARPAVGCPTATHALALRAAREALSHAGLDPSGGHDLRLYVGNSAIEYTVARKWALWRGRNAGGDPSAGGRARGAGGAVVRTDGAGDDDPPALEEFALCAWLRRRLALRGAFATLASNCVAGLQAIVLAARHIAAGRSERALAGGVECAVTPEMIARFRLLRALSGGTDPACSRPFDVAHGGMVLGDGAGFLVLESAAAACRRGIRPMARLAGFGLSTDAYHVTRGAPDARAKAAAIGQALAMAGCGAAGVDVVYAHGTGTVDNDVTEIRALRLALGRHAERVAVTAPKSALGHSLAASAAVESAFAVLTIRDGVVPPIVNLTRPAPECDVAGLVRARRLLAARAVLKNAFAFGGLNACAIFAPWRVAA